MTSLHCSGARPHGTASASAQATRILERFGTARLTVVDRFGRSDSESSTYYPIGLIQSATAGYWSGIIGVNFTKGEGVNYVGRAWSYCSPYPCTTWSATAFATLSGIHDIRLTVPDRGLAYQGTIANDGTMTVLQTSGPGTGTTWKLKYKEEY